VSAPPYTSAVTPSILRLDRRGPAERAALAVAVRSLQMLEHFIAANRAEIILRCRAKVATRLMPAPTEAEIDFGVPVFLDQLMEALRHGPGTNPAIGKSALHHGHELLAKGFTV
jgi:hypothetical protein